VGNQEQWIEVIKKLPTWVSGTISLVTAIIGFVLLLQGHYYLGTTILGIFVVVALLFSCVYLAFAKTKPIIERGTGVYRFEKYRPWAFIGIGLIVGISIAILILKSGRSHIRTAFIGTATPTATSTPSSPPTSTLTSVPSPTPKPPDISLASLSFEVNGSTPRVIDLRNVETTGIAVKPGDRLSLTDLWYAANQDGAGDFYVNAEAYVGEQPIGSAAEGVSVERGIHRIGDFTPSSFVSGDDPEAWQVQAKWSKLTVVLVLYQDNQVVERERLKIVLSEEGSPGLVPVDEIPPSLSLFSLSYRVDDFDPHLVDLRKASISGIPAYVGSSLQFFDLWISIPKDAPECTFWAEISDKPDNSNVIGVTTEYKPLRAGHAKLGNVGIVDEFKHELVPYAWRVRPDWTDLYITLLTFCDGNVVDYNVTTIHLDVNGTAWLLDPPNASFASIVYAVNEGPEQVLDLRDATERGLGVGPGDEITFLEIWYHANADGGNEFKMQAEAYLTSGGFDQDTFKVTPVNMIQKGIHRLSDSIVLSWVIPDDRDSLVLSLSRSDKVIMDRLVFPLGSQ
jgi:hypothetical protein